MHVKDSPFTIDVTPADPPYFRNAFFEAHLAGARVNFDRDTDMGNGAFVGIFDCERLVDSTTYALVGKGSRCSWTSARSFSISFGADASVRRGSPISVQAGLLRNAVRNSKFVNGRAFLLLPDDAMAPEPVIYAPTKIAPCDSLRLDASSSYGDGGRDMVFSWGMELGPDNRDKIIDILAALPSGQRVVDLPKSTLSAGTTYIFTLNVRNFIDEDSLGFRPRS